MRVYHVLRVFGTSMLRVFGTSGLQDFGSSGLQDFGLRVFDAFLILKLSK
jgi:hypothetical protein